MTAAIELSGVTAEYEAGRPVLSGVDLRVGPGEFVAVVGRSGTGKTTLLRVIGGLLRPREGEVSVLGGAPGLAARAKRIGLVFQDAPLHPWRTVRANVELPLRVNRVRPAAGDGARAWLDRVGLGDAADAYPYQLSGGMRQRVALARSLVLEPEVLLMDEPLASLDELTRESMREEILRLWSATRSAVVHVTHDLSEAVFLADRVVVIAGRPARKRGEVTVPLPRPRTAAVRRDPAFFASIDAVRALLS